MKEHMRATHTKQMTQEELLSITINIEKCKNCDYKTHRSDNMKHHVKTHYIRKCKHCDYKTHLSDNMKNHVMNQHDNKLKRKKTYPKLCKYCDYKNVQSSKMKQHMKANHTKQMTQEELLSISINVMKCKLCDYETHRSDYMRNHDKSHNKKSNCMTYKCDLCKYQFFNMSRLRKHLTNSHKNDKVNDNEYFEPKDEKSEEVDDPDEVDEHSNLQEIKNEISDDEEKETLTPNIDVIKLEPKVELTKDFLEISDDKMEDKETTSRRQIESSVLPKGAQYLCPISYCSFLVSDNDRNKRLSHMALRHKNIDLNCSNFIKL